MTRRDFFGPALFKELATQLRGSRAALMITIFVGLVLIIARLLYGLVLSQLDFGAPLLSAQIGQVLFIGIGLVAQALIIGIAPAATVNAVSQEYERGTFELIRATPLSMLQLLAGKLLAALAFLLLLTLAAAPALTLVALFGGVGPTDIARFFFTATMTAVVCASFGLCCSALIKQTYSATLLCYAVLTIVVGGTLFAANVWSLMNGMRAAPPWMLTVNPLSAMATALASAQPPATSFTGGFRPLVLLTMLAHGAINVDSQSTPLFRGTAVLYGGMSLLLFWVALLGVRPRLRPAREDALMLVALLAFGLAAFLLRGWWMPGVFPA